MVGPIPCSSNARIGTSDWHSLGPPLAFRLAFRFGPSRWHGRRDLRWQIKDDELAPDRLKNAAATKKLAIFDAFEILSRIDAERQALEAPADKTKSKGGFAEQRAK